MQARTYLVVVLGVAAAVVGGVFAVNARVDPYGLAAATIDDDQAGEDARPGGFWRSAFAVHEALPRTVVLGTSRAKFGIDPRYPGFAAGSMPVQNLALGGLSIEQIRLLLIHANATSPLRMAVIGLDLESFLDDGRTDFDPAALEGNAASEPERLVRLRLAVSREMLLASVARLAAPAAATAAFTEARKADEAPSHRITEETLKRWQGQRGMIWTAEYSNFYARLPLLFPKGSLASRWNADKRRAAAMTSFRELLDYARRHDIELRLFISPVHARHLEWYQRVGWWPLFEAWKRALVDAIAEESKAAPGKPAFALWDFGGYNALSTERVPEIGDWSTQMRWYRDTSHYSPEAGNLVLGHLLGGGSGTGASLLPAVRLDASTLPRQLSGIRYGAIEYRLTQPGEVADIADMLIHFRRVAKR